MTKKIISVILTLAMILSMTAILATTAFADTNYACKIGDTEYETITDALDDVEGSTETTITLLRNVTESIIIPDHANIKLDLAGFALSAESGKRIIETINTGYDENNFGSLTIVSSVTDSVHRFDENYCLNDALTDDTATLTVNGGVLTGGSDDTGDTGGGAINNKKSNISAENVSFVNNKAQLGGAVLSWYGGSMKFTDCQFLYNTGYAGYGFGGGAICVDSTDDGAEFTNCTFKHNYSASTRYGGGALLHSGEKLEITECVFEDNKAAVRGGAISTCIPYPNAVINCTDTVFSNNQAGSCAGAIALESEVTTLTGCTITNNEIFGECTAGGWGSAIDCRGELTLDDCTITGNAFKYNNEKIKPGAIHYDDYGYYTEWLTNLIIKGDTKVQDNYAGTAQGEIKVEANVFIDKNEDSNEIKTIKFDNIGTNAKIGVGLKDYNNAFTPDNYAEFKNYFTADAIYGESVVMEMAVGENDALRIIATPRISEQPSDSNNYTVTVDMSGLSYDAPEYQWYKKETIQVGDYRSFDAEKLYGDKNINEDGSILVTSEYGNIGTEICDITVNGDEGFDYITFTSDSGKITVYAEADNSTMSCTPSTQEGYYDYVYTYVPGGYYGSYFYLVTSDFTNSTGYTISDLYFFKVKGTPVEDTDATLSSGTLGKDYYCKITFEDGSALNTDIVTVQENDKDEYTVSTLESDSKSCNGITLKAVTVADAEGQEITGLTVKYAINTTNEAPTDGWQTGLTFTGLDLSTTYYFFVKVDASTNYEAFTSEGVEIATTEHNLTSVAAKAVTCIEDGHIAYDKCTYCNRMFIEGEPVSENDVAITAKGEHTWGEWKNGKRTCTAEGCDADEICEHEGVRGGETCPVCGEETENEGRVLAYILSVISTFLTLIFSLFFF